jgi:hypothetical protein
LKFYLGTTGSRYYVVLYSPTATWEWVSPLNFVEVFCLCGVRGDAVGWGTALQAGRLRLRLPMESLRFFIDSVLPAALCSWVDLASTRNEYQGCILWSKSCRCAGLSTWPPSCADLLATLEATSSRNFRGLSRSKTAITHLQTEFYLTGTVPQFLVLVASNLST